MKELNNHFSRIKSEALQNFFLESNHSILLKNYKEKCCPFFFKTIHSHILVNTHKIEHLKGV